MHAEPVLKIAMADLFQVKGWQLVYFTSDGPG